MTDYPYPVWSRYQAGLHAIVLAEPDKSGKAPARISIPEQEDDQNGLILLEEWSETELSPTPQTVPGTLYLVMGGQDPFNPQYQVSTTEADAKALVTAGAWGYVPIQVSRLMQVS